MLPPGYLDSVAHAHREKSSVIFLMYLKESKTEMWSCHTLNGQLEPRTSCGLVIIPTYMNHMRYTAEELKVIVVYILQSVSSYS